MRVTESQLRRIVRRALHEATDPAPGVLTFFMDGGRAPVELARPAELLPLLLAAESPHLRLAFVVSDLEAGGVSFERVGAPPAGWEGMWWWPLPPGGGESSKAAVMRSPRYGSMLDAAVASLQERGGESLHVFGRAPGLPEVRLRVGEAWEDPDLLPAGFSRGWWRDLVGGLELGQDPVEWIGSDDQMVR